MPFDHDVAVAGLSADYPAVHCTATGVCLMTTGMGHANAAASTMAVVLSPRLDLSQAYVLIAGMIMVGVMMPFNSGGWKIVNAALFMIVTAEVVHHGVAVASYRRQAS